MDSEQSQSIKRRCSIESLEKHTVKRPCYDQKEIRLPSCNPGVLGRSITLPKNDIENWLVQFEDSTQHILSKDIVTNNDKLCVSQMLHNILLRLQPQEILTDTLLAETFYNLIEYLRHLISYEDVTIMVHNLHLSESLLFDIMSLCDNTEVLLDAKYNVDVLLYNAAVKQHINSVKLLVTYGANPTCVPANFTSSYTKMELLYHVCQYGSASVNESTQKIEIIEFLMPYYSNDQLSNIFYALATDTNSSFDMLLLFKNRGVNVDYLLANENNTALMRACNNGFDKRCLTLIELGANVNYVNSTGDSPLQLTCYGRAFGSRYSQERFNIVRALVTNGADVNYVNKNNTALSLLLEKNASGAFGAFGTFGAFGALKSAYENEITIEFKMITYLIDQGANVNHATSSKYYGDYSILAHAYRHRKDMKIMECLLSHGADVNYINRSQDTPKTVLMMALEDSEFEIVKLLLRYKADPTMASKQIEQYISFAKVLDDYVKSI